MTKTNATEAEAIASLAINAAASHVVEAGNRRFLVVPEGFAQEEISDENGLKLSKPSYIEQAAKIETADSLVDYVRTFKADSTLLFADISGNHILAAIDYHSAKQAEHVAHTARLDLKFSEEWALWTGISGKLMGQLDFARFVEENAADIVAPSAGELLDTCRDLQVHRKVNFVKAVRTASDNENFEWTEETNATGKRGELELPTRFMLSLPVYFGERPVELHAFLRWRLNDGVLMLGIQLHRLEHVRQAVFRLIVLAVADRAGVPCVFGSPNG